MSITSRCGRIEERLLRHADCCKKTPPARRQSRAVTLVVLSSYCAVAAVQSIEDLESLPSYQYILRNGASHFSRQELPRAERSLRSRA